MNQLLSVSSSFPTNVHLCLQFCELLLVHDSFFHLEGVEMGPCGGTRSGAQGVSGRPAGIRDTHGVPPIMLFQISQNIYLFLIENFRITFQVPAKVVI